MVFSLFLSSSLFLVIVVVDDQIVHCVRPFVESKSKTSTSLKENPSVGFGITLTLISTTTST